MRMNWRKKTHCQQGAHSRCSSCELKLIFFFIMIQAYYVVFLSIAMPLLYLTNN